MPLLAPVSVPHDVGANTANKAQPLQHVGGSAGHNAGTQEVQQI